MFLTYLTVIGIMSTLTIILYSYDKVASGADRFRVPVYVLNMATALGGGVGAFFSMILYRHKNKKMNFRILIYYCLAVQVITLIALAII